MVIKHAEETKRKFHVAEPKVYNWQNKRTITLRSIFNLKSIL